MSSTEIEEKLRQFLSLIKWASLVQKQSSAQGSPTLHPQSSSTKKPPSRLSSLSETCTAKGSGLKVGLVGRRSKVDIYTPSSDVLDLQFIVRGPCGEICMEKIVSMFPSLKRLSSVSGLLDETRSTKLWHAGASKLINHNGRATPTHKKVPDPAMEAIDETQKIPFDYDCIGEGQFLISYMPRSSGLHTVSIKWHGNHIRGSPFLVEVAETLEKLNEYAQSRGRAHQQKLSFESKRRESVPQCRVMGDSDDHSDSGSEDSSGMLPSGVTAAVLNRTSKVQRSISRTHIAAPQLVKQATVTRRRVLKRVVTKGGQEFVIMEAPPTPHVLSRECSSASDDMAEPELSQPKWPVGSSLRVNTVYKQAVKSLQDATKTRKPDREASHDGENGHDIVRQILDGVIADVTNITSQILRASDRSISAKCHKRHRSLASTKSFPLSLDGQQASLLLLPHSDNRFVCSPFAEGPERAPMENTRQYSTDSDCTSPDPVKEHRPLSATKSYPLIPEEKAQKLHTPGDINSQTINANSYKTSKYPGKENRIHAAEGHCAAKGETQSQTASSRDENRVEQAEQESRESDNHNKNTDTNGKQNQKHEAVRKTLSDPSCHLNTQKKDTNHSFSNQVGHISSNTGGSTASPTKPMGEIHRTDNAHHTPPKLWKQRTRTESQCDSEMEFRINSYLEKPDGPKGEISSKNEASVAGNTPHPKLSVVAKHNRLRMSTSLPSLFKRWTAFELDPEDDTLTIEEMEKLSMSMQAQKKRATLCSGESLGEFNSMDERDPEKIFHEMKRNHSSSGTNGSSQIDGKMSPMKDLFPSSDSLLVGISIPMTPSPALSPMSTPSTSRHHSRRGSLTTVTERHGTTKDHAISHLQCGHSNQNQGLGFDAKTLLSSSSKSKSLVDKSTQGTYEEIKAETGWVRPKLYVRPRRKIVRSFAKEQSSSSDSVKRMAAEKKADGEVPCVGGASLLSVDSRRQIAVSNKEQAIRQSTVETTDSGITEDTSICSPVGSSSTARAQRVPKPSVINGHRTVTRNRYRGKISLDPKLISNSPGSPAPNADDQKKIGESLARKKVRAGILAYRYCRSISGSRRLVGQQRSKEDSVSENEGRSLRVLGHGQKVSSHKRRVRFSRRVMLYRRSSSRHSHEDGSKSEPRTPGLDKGGKPRRHRGEAKNARSLMSAAQKGQPRAENGANPSVAMSSVALENPNANTKTTGSTDITLRREGTNDIYPAEERAEALAHVEEVHHKGATQDQLIPEKQEPLHSSTDTFDGFGVSAATRKDMLDELDAFSRISSASGNENISAAKFKRKRYGSAPDALKHLRKSGSSFDLGAARSSARAAYSDIAQPVTESFSRDDSLAAQFLPTEDASQRVADYLKRTFGSMSVAPTFHRSPPTDSDAGTIPGERTLAPRQYLHQLSYSGMHRELDSVFMSADQADECIPEEISGQSPEPAVVHFSMCEEVESPAITDSTQSNQIPDPFLCTAFGPGLVHAEVNMKTFFQVKFTPKCFQINFRNRYNIN